MTDPTNSDDEVNLSCDNKKDAQLFSEKHGFRLTPEEQELAYTLKAKMMCRLDEQNSKLKQELAIHHQLKQLKQQQRQSMSARSGQDQKLTHSNAIKLMRMYKRRANEAEEEITRLQSDLAKAEELSQRYRNMYVRERDNSPHCGQSQKIILRDNSQKDNAKKDKSIEDQKRRNAAKDKKQSLRDANSAVCENEEEKFVKVTEDDLHDDKALFEKHIARVVETSSMITTSPIRIEDIVRKNQCLLVENSSLHNEVQSLRRDNSVLVKRVKLSTEDKNKLQHQASTSEVARTDLRKRLQKEQIQHNSLKQSLTRQATAWIKTRKEMREEDHKQRWSMIHGVSIYGAAERTYMHPAKYKTNHPRKMFSVELYGSANQTKL